MKDFVKKNAILVIAVLAYIVVFIVKQEVFFESLKMTGMFLKEMIEVLPPIIVITSLITVWVPREIITKNFGKSSGLKGKLLSLLIGSVSAGPIYAAFPVSQTLLKKGASVSNIVIILSSWAVIKVPMLIVEMKFLGVQFALTRYLLTVPLIFLMGFIMEKVVKQKDLPPVETGKGGDPGEIMSLLPGYNCKACGYLTCAALSEAVVQGEEEVKTCKFVAKKMAAEKES